MSLDNVHIPIRNGCVLSIASINRKLEIAIVDDDFFVTDSYFEDLYDAVMPIFDIKDLYKVVKRILEVEYGTNFMDNHRNC